MTHLRFADDLIDLILDGEKDTTWRIWHDREKTVDVNETVSLQDNDYTEFAKAQVQWVKKTTFGRLTDEDRAGHESFDSEQELYQTYEQYYDRTVDTDTPVIVIKFTVLETAD